MFLADLIEFFFEFVNLGLVVDDTCSQIHNFCSACFSLILEFILQAYNFWLVAPAEQDVIKLALSAAFRGYTTQVLQRKDIPIATGQEATQSTQRDGELIGI